MDRTVAIAGCHARSDLRFAYLNLHDHPRGQVMLRNLIKAGFVPTLVIDEVSSLATKSRAGQLSQLQRTSGFIPEPATAELCARLGIAYAQVPNHNAVEVPELLTAHGAALGVLGDCRIIGDSVRAVVPHGILNVHPGCLPDVRGNNPYIWAVVRDLPQGATVHLIDGEIDRGPILLARRHTIRPGGLPMLIRNLNDLCATMLVEALDLIVAGRATVTPQAPDDRPTFGKAPDEIYTLAAKMLDNADR